MAETDARRFRVERKGPFKVNRSRDGWTVIHDGPDDEWKFGWLHRNGYFVDYEDDAMDHYETNQAWLRVCEEMTYPTDAEAQFLLLLATDPRKALQPFLEHDSRGGIISYEGTCGGCDGLGYATAAPFSGTHYAAAVAYDIPCFTCHGTGGPPSRDLLGIAADWFGDDWRADVLRSVTK